MATFGRFEAVREIHRTGYTTVYAGRSPESASENVVIKIFQPPASLLEGRQAKTEIDLFLKSTKAQQKAASGDAQHWAPVHQHGSIPGGAFYVTEKYEHSLKQLIDIRLKPSSKVLSAIVESVAKGLMELKESCGRPHGNLKATNVLISGTEDITQGKIVLCDPLPDELINTEVHWESDLRAIAELIYQLVVHQQTPHVDGWQAPDSKEWRNLGRNAASWRNLCNQLLSAAAKPGTITIETVIEELGQLKIAKPFFSPLRLITAALVIIVCVLALVIFWPSAPAKQEEWNRLCKEYVAWVGPLYEKLKSRKNNEMLARWSKDGDLKKIVEKVREHASYPDKKAELGYGDVNDIMDADPKSIGAEDRETKNALEAIEHIKDFLDPNSADDPNAYKPWPLLVEIHKKANDFKERGWEKPAAYLAFLVSSVRPESNKTIAENVDKILNLKKENTLDEIETSRNQITKYQTIVKSIKDPILSKFNDEFVKREVALIDGRNDGEVLSTLQNKLEDINDLGDELAKFIQNNWQKVDQIAYFEDRGKDPVVTLTKAVFLNRLKTIENYYYLRPNPRDELFGLDGLDSRIKNYMELALKINPIEASKCKEDYEKLQPNLDKIINIRGIEKNRGVITKAVRMYKPQMNELLKRVIEASELPEDYWKRIKDETLLVKVEEINQKWEILRDNLLNKYPLASIKEDTDLYVELRRKIDDVNDNLVKLDKEMQRELPSQINVPLKGTGWNSKIKEAYEQYRKESISSILQKLPLKKDIPDLTSQEFIKSKQAEYTLFKKDRQDLTGIVTAFNAIEFALDACYLLDDQMPEKVQNFQNIRTLWEEWKDNKILDKQSVFYEAFTTPVERIADFWKLDTETDRQVLTEKALAPGARPEITYAAWTRLGLLSAPFWPNDYEDVKKDRTIRATLKMEFETIRQSNEERGGFLLKTLAGTGIDREIVFIEKNSFKDETKSSTDKILTKFDETAAKEKGLAELAELEKLGGLAEELGDFVSNPDWPQKFYLDLLEDDQKPLYNKSTLTAEDFEFWLQKVILYKKLEQDPRKAYTWEEKIADITKLIEDELDIKEEDSSKQNSTKPDGISLFGKITEITRPIENVLRRKQPGSSKDNIAKLKLAYDQFKVTVEEVNDLLERPAIEKYKDDIDANKCKVLWEKLLGHEATIKSIIKPEYCKYLKIIEDKTQEIQRLVFDEKETEIYKNFEPFNYSQLQTPDESGLSLNKLKEILNKLTLEQIKNRLNETVKLADWDEIRQAIKGQQRKWLDFFETVDLNNKNYGWPKYIISKKDPSVVLRFIPAGPGNPEPFYMATQEISNSQYRLFLERNGAKSDPVFKRFQDSNTYQELIRWRTGKHPCQIRWKNSRSAFETVQGHENIPVVWVTYNGAQSYAKWLGAQLPTVSQHVYACQANTGDIRPWGNDPSQISSYVHARGPAYQKAAIYWNNNKDNLVPPLPIPPVGALENYGPNRTVDPNVVYNQATYDSAWPIANANTANSWDLYDMIGNVWEWCRNENDNDRPVICGGSCLARKEYIENPSNYSMDFDTTDCDVGFRIIVPAR